jgi:hypothetical protein
LEQYNWVAVIFAAIASDREFNMSISTGAGFVRLSLSCLAALAFLAFVQQASAQQPGVTGAGPRLATKPAAATGGNVSAEAAEVLAFEKDMEAATVRGDVAYIDKVTAPDLSFTHGDAWTRGGKPLGVDDKAGYLKRVANKQYLARDLDSVKVELHGDVAITYGRYIAQSRGGDQSNAWFSVWFERVYEKRDGHWLYVSHRTVHGPTRGPTRESVSDK